MDFRIDQHPVVIAVAGPNGAGKSTFFDVHLRPVGVRFINADVIAREHGLDPYVAAEVAGRLRDEMIVRRESFAFETVLSDPVGEKVEFLRWVAEEGYTVVLCFIGLESTRISSMRVAMRVSKGGHDVPTDKLISRLPRTLANLKRALAVLPCVVVYDNSKLRQPFHFVAEYQRGQLVRSGEYMPQWFKALIEPI